MSKRVLDVGNCVPDHAAIRNMLTSTFDVKVLQTHGPEDTLALLHREPIDLVVINRKLDQDYSDGIEIYIETVGCQMNMLDSELVVASLRKEGYELTADRSRPTRSCSTPAASASTPRTRSTAPSAG
jgi:hypothetical protein